MTIKSRALVRGSVPRRDSEEEISDFNLVSNAYKSSSRYPVPLQEYRNIVGKLAEVLVKVLLEELTGKDYVTPHTNGNGPDIIGIDISLKGEVLNWKEFILGPQRAEKIQFNLSRTTWRFLIGFGGIKPNKEAKECLKDIPICYIPFQLIPAGWEAFFKAHHDMEGRRALNRHSIRYVKNTLRSFLYQLDSSLLIHYDIEHNKASVEVEETKYSLLAVKSVESRKKCTGEKLVGTLSERDEPPAREESTRPAHYLIPPSYRHFRLIKHGWWGGRYHIIFGLIPPRETKAEPTLCLLNKRLWHNMRRWHRVRPRPRWKHARKPKKDCEGVASARYTALIFFLRWSEVKSIPPYR